MMTTFNPKQLKESVLAPCHSLILQFYVDDDNFITYCRSADLFLEFHLTLLVQLYYYI